MTRDLCLHKGHGAPRRPGGGHAHARHDRAVWAAYGWDDLVPAWVDEDVILALNLAGAAGATPERIRDRGRGSGPAAWSIPARRHMCHAASMPPCFRLSPDAGSGGSRNATCPAVPPLPRVSARWAPAHQQHRRA